jgi:hypothetical protein
MSVTAPAPAASAEETTPAEVVVPPARKAWPVHLLVAAIALAAAVVVTVRLWHDPYGRALSVNVGDQAFFEWVIAYGMQVLGHGADPFFTDLMNAPLGVNLAANTSITVYAVLFSPLTYLAGPQVTFVTILTLNLACSGFGWYLFLQRWVVRNKFAAIVGGLFIGFAPGFVSHANGHLNFTSGWIAPLVLWWVMKLREPGRWLRNGAVTGVILAVGFSIAAEGLFFTALASATFVVVWSCSRRTWPEARVAAPTVFAALGVTALVAGALLAYPLYMHFDGPQTFGGTGFSQRHYAEDIAAYISFSSRTLAAHFGLASAYLAPNSTEQTSFLGLPLVILTIGSLIMLWWHSDAGRRATLRAIGVVGVIFFVLSLGPRLKVLGYMTDVPLPYAILARGPLFNSALPARLALVVTAIVGVILALAADRLLSMPQPAPTVRAAFGAAFVVALLPLTPTPLKAMHRVAEPAFISQGLWKQYVPDGMAMTELPFGSNAAADMMRWQAYTMARGGQQFKIPDGYFLGPGGQDGKGRIGAPRRRTDWTFYRAATFGEIAKIRDYDRAQARLDFQYWGVTAVFLPKEITGPQGPLHRAAVLTVATDLLGPPKQVGDVLLWTIRPGVDPVTPDQP